MNRFLEIAIQVSEPNTGRKSSQTHLFENAWPDKTPRNILNRSERVECFMGLYHGKVG